LFSGQAAAGRKRRRSRQSLAQENSQHGEEHSDASNGVFYELEKHPVGFFMFGVVHRGMARGLSMILSHCVCHSCVFLFSVAFAMIFIARKREKDRICQIFVQSRDLCKQHAS
jgi:hypothetical protein